MGVVPTSDFTVMTDGPGDVLSACLRDEKSIHMLVHHAYVSTHIISMYLHSSVH